MGTNYYLRSKEPVEIKPQYEWKHIAKCSAGWLPLFDSSGGVNSVAEIKKLVKSGEWVILNEYDEELSWEEFTLKVLGHGNWYGNDLSHIEHVAEEYPSQFKTYYTDDAGFEFCTREFS